MTIIRGSCLCGGVSFELEGKIEHFYLCHCEHCRKDTGSAHSANLFADNATLRWLKGQTLLKTYNLPGSRHMKAFCSQCGSALPVQSADGLAVVVPAGSVDGPLPVTAQAHLFSASRADWDAELERLPAFDGLPDLSG